MAAMHSDKSQVFKILGLAAAYLASGKLALLLALPPGYASPVWPASGIALGALLLWGQGIWPGVFLGSVLVNLTQTLHAQPNLTTAALVLLGIASGAGLQALAGALLIRRLTGFPIPVQRTGTIFAAITLGGPISCLLGATLGVATLVLSGVLAPEQAPANWWAWWQGDTLGALSVLPLVSVWRMQMHRSTAANRFKTLLPMTVALAFSLGIFCQSRQAQWTTTRLEFEMRCNDAAALLNSQLENYLNDLHAIRNFYMASKEVEPGEFATFADPMLARHPGLKALEWVPRVPRSRREMLESELSSDIREGGESEKLHPAGQRDEYFPVRFIEPLAGNEEALGFDLGSSAERKAALARARDEGEAIASAPLHLVQDTVKTPAILLLLPVYGAAGVPARVEDRRKELKGFVVGVLRVAEAMRTALDTTSLNYLGLRIFDDSASGDMSLFTWLPDKENPSPRQPLQAGRILPVGGRSWRLEFTATEAFLSTQENWRARMVLTSGLLFSCLLGIFSFVVAGRSEAIRSQVRTRTSELAEANKQLAAESATLKELTSALEESELRHRAIVENAVDGIITIDEQGLIQSFNPAAEKLFGYDCREVAGKNISILQPEPHRSWHDAYLRRYLETGEAHILGIGREVSGKRRDGTEFPLDLSVSEIQLGGRRLFIGILRDITLRKEAEATLKSANERLLEVDRLKSMFVASMSHELRTPLNSIIGFSSILLNEWAGPVNEEQRENLDIIARTGKHLLALINDVIDVSKIEAGRLDVHQDRFDLHELISEVVQVLLSQAQSQGLEVEVENLHHSMHTDRLRLFQCTLNLLSNAIKYTLDGNITLSAKLLTKGYVEIAVRDTGIGIPEEDRAKIFQPFIRLESAIKSYRKGTGLGLFLTHKLATEVLGGTLRFESVQGKGSCFILNLPERLEGA